MRLYPGEDIANPKDLARFAIAMRARDEFDEVVWSVCLSAVHQLSDQLAVVLGGTRSQRAKLLKQYAGKIPLGLHLVPIPHADGRRTWQIVADEVLAVFAIRSVSFLDPDMKFGGLLRRCALPECGHYFLTQGKVRSRPYCTDKHL